MSYSDKTIKEEDTVCHEFLTVLSLIMHPCTLADVKAMLNVSLLGPYFPDMAGESIFTLHDYAAFLKNSGKIPEPGIKLSVSDKYQRERMALELIGAKPELAKLVATALPWQARADSYESLVRDIRNYLYAGDLESMRLSIRLLSKNSKEKFFRGESFSFLQYVCDSKWLSSLDVQMLSQVCVYYLPLSTAMLRNTDDWESHIDKMSEVAKMFWVDQLLLKGRVEDAKRLLEPYSGNSRKLREAWISFIEGRIDDSINEYLELLTRIRSENSNQTLFFQSIGGIFFIFALLKDGSKKRMEMAAEYAGDAISTPYIGVAYAKIADLIKAKLQDSRESMEPCCSENDLSKACPLARFFLFFCEAWDGKESVTKVESEGLELISRIDNSYEWVLSECRKCLALINGTGEKSFFENTMTSIADCFDIIPKWKRVLGRLQEVVKQPNFDVENRLVWICTEDNCNNECPIQMKPLEQRASKTRKWSKGRHFQLLRYCEEKTLPDYLTTQDRVICSLIAEDYQGVSKRDSQGMSFSSLRALNAAVGHPLLFWDGPVFTRFNCRKEKPILYLAEKEELLTFTVYPSYVPEKECTPVRDAQGDLLIYNFTRIHSAILDEIGNDFAVPMSLSQKLSPLLFPFAEAFRLLSNVNLDFTQLPMTEAATDIHVRLVPANERMRVELLVQPFPNMSDLYKPGTGALEYVRPNYRSIERVVRNFDTEVEVADSIISLCDGLSEEFGTSDWCWELPNLEECYNFTLSLQKLKDKVQVHWPDNQKIRISRRLTVKDMSIRCKHLGDWLFSIDGTVKVDNGLVLSLKEIMAASKNRRGNFIKLEDGQIIALADSFRKRLDDIAAVTMEDKEGGYSFKRCALPFMELLIADISSRDEAYSVWKKYADNIRTAMELTPEIPEGLLVTLRPYQIQGYTWLYQLDAWGAGACLADDMGLGKTIQTIAFILSKAAEGPTLVVAPTSVCSNWQNELSRFAPSLNVVSFGGVKRQEMLTKVGPGVVMVTSYGLLQSEADAFNKVEWRIAVLDEAQAIKNHNTKRSRAAVRLSSKFRIVTTGTPMENNLNELWAIFDFINPGLLGTHQMFQEQFAIPIEKNNDTSCLKRLEMIVKPFILRRRKSQVLPELPPKTEIQIQVNLSSEEWAFYESLRQNLVEEIKGLGQEPGHLRMKVIAAITKLRLAACNPRLAMEESTIPSSKLAMFSELLDNLLVGGHKILVFSQFVKHLALIRPVLEERNIEYRYLDGNVSVNDRKMAVEDFQKGKGNVFLISLKAGGLGLNLTAADYVIHLDPWWNPAVEDQASDRAHRIGQNKPVTIYRLIAQNTIEDKILELHQSKRDLADKLLAGTDSIEKISPDELYRLLVGE